jgi:hypothetical protein
MKKKNKKAKKVKTKNNETKFFIAILLVFVALFFVSSAYKSYKINSEANKIAESVVNGEEIDEQALSNLANKDYNELKKELGIGHDFLVHFEDKDGNPIKISGMYCFGYDEIANQCK